jgi:hypothetical protein
MSGAKLISSPSSVSGVEHSAMVPASITAPLGAPLIETGGRSRAPLVIGAAALLAFAVVFLVMFIGKRPEPQPPVAATPPPPVTVTVTVPAPAPPAPVAAAAPAVDPSALPADDEPTLTTKPGKVGRAARTAKGAPAAAAPAAAKPAAPAPAAAAPPPSDVDLSSPYR